jgi:predicted GNAT family acetyltransferase
VLPSGVLNAFSSPLRALDDRDRDAVLALCAQDPVANVFVSSRVEASGVDGDLLSGQLWGYHHDGELVAACWAGANVVPVQVGPDTLDAFVHRLRRSGRRCSSLVGSADAVMGLWHGIAGSWGGARDVRADQPLMAITGEPLLASDPGVRMTTPADLEALVPACVAMFTEEVGYSPVAGDGGASYRARVEELVRAGRSFARFEHHEGRQRVVFKAELGAVGPGVAQVQGVWVHPEHRGRGYAAPGMAAVVRATAAQGLATTSLYVNDYNTRALQVYRRVGFEQVGTFATVLF